MATTNTSEGSPAESHASPQGTPARKGLISYLRTLPKGTLIWIQGVIVHHRQDSKEIAVDDGSGIARVQFKSSRLIFPSHQALRVGSYVMAVGAMQTKLRDYRMGVVASIIRDLSANGPFLETLWNVEVVDAYLLRHEMQLDSDHNDQVTNNNCR